MIVAIVAAITFALIHLAPGDPFSAVIDNPNVSEKVRETLRAQYGLDRPLPEQFVRYVNALAHGELYRGKTYLGLPAGKAYVIALERNLRKWGYIR